jgi:hypothetical protein
MDVLSPKQFSTFLQQRRGVSRPKIVCMAKPAPSDAATVLVAPVGRCGPWIALPLEAVEHVVPLTTCPCDDHEHPVVAIYLAPRSPASVQVLSHFYADAQHRLVAGNMAPNVVARNAGGGTIDPGIAHGCFFFPLPICWRDPLPPTSPDGTPWPADPGPEYYTYSCVVIPMPSCY